MGLQDPHGGAMFVAGEEQGKGKHAFSIGCFYNHQTFMRQHGIVVKELDWDIRMPGWESQPSLLGPG